MKNGTSSARSVHRVSFFCKVTDNSPRFQGVINATGPFTDGMRKLDNQQVAEIVAPSSGVHITLPNYYGPKGMGLLDPNTSDGRVIFFLPWQGNVIAGTTDSPSAVEPHPLPKEEEIQWILDEVRHYLSPDIKVRRGDVLSAWSGLRPLVRDPDAADTQSLVRNHMINTSESGLMTIAGGKWTTYRAMAEETVDAAIKEFNLKPLGPCQTEHIKLIGAHAWSHTMFIKLIQQFGLDTEVAKHLSNTYGDRAWTVAAMAEENRSLVADSRHPSLAIVPLHRGRSSIRLPSGIRPQGYRLYRSTHAFEFP